jgi:hypothetical protein
MLFLALKDSAEALVLCYQNSLIWFGSDLLWILRLY